MSPTWQLHGQTDERFVPVGGAVIGVGQETHPVSLSTVGGPHLPPIDHIFIPFLHRLGHDTLMEVWWSVQRVTFGTTSARTGG